MIVIHGENIIQSRNKLMQIINQAKNDNILVERLVAKDLDLPHLESKLQKTDLFGHSRMIVIEELHSLSRSKKLTAMIELLVKSDLEICLWEKRQLTAVMLKKLGKAQLYEFKLANSLFSWLDSLSPNNSTKTQQLKYFQEAIAENDEFMCFAMLVRQVRLLIQASSNGEIKGPYFVINKIRSQARQFSLPQLLKLHQQLYQLDLEIKTSTNHLTLSQSIELIITNL